MIHDVTVRDVRALAARRQTLNVRDLCRHFRIGVQRAEELLALAARAPCAEESDPAPTHLEAQLMRDHRFSRSEAAAAAQSMNITGDIKAHG